MEVTDRKDEIRQAMREKRHYISDAVRRTAGHQIADSLIDKPIDLFLRTQAICIYLSTPHEIPTHTIARYAWTAGKQVCVPVWDSQMQEYSLALLQPDTPFICGKYGIREPAIKIPFPIWEVNAFIMPGLAYDKRGGRLGYGGGYYDRLINQSTKSTLKIGIGYDWQITSEPLPQEPSDQPIDWIVTDRQVLRCTPPPSER